MALIKCAHGKSNFNKSQKFEKFLIFIFARCTDFLLSARRLLQQNLKNDSYLRISAFICKSNQKIYMVIGIWCNIKGV